MRSGFRRVGRIRAACGNSGVRNPSPGGSVGFVCIRDVWSFESHFSPDASVIADDGLGDVDGSGAVVSRERGRVDPGTVFQIVKKRSSIHSRRGTERRGGKSSEEWK